MAKHTAAPWKARIDETATVRDKDGQIAIFTHLKTVTGGRRNSDEVAANARLAAAAPELLAALQKVMSVMPVLPTGADAIVGYRNKYDMALVQAKRVIKKATGQCLKGEE